MRIAGVCAVLCGLAGPTAAEIVRIEIISRGRRSTVSRSEPLGPTRNQGHRDRRDRSADPRNALITDIDLAPRKARGMVAYRTTFTHPQAGGHDPIAASSSTTSSIGAAERPEHLALRRRSGDGFLYKLGHVMLWSGWQGDMPIATVGADQEGIDVPMAKNRDGSPVTGRVWRGSSTSRAA